MKSDLKLRQKKLIAVDHQLPGSMKQYIYRCTKTLIKYLQYCSIYFQVEIQDQDTRPQVSLSLSWGRSHWGHDAHNQDLGFSVWSSSSKVTHCNKVPTLCHNRKEQDLKPQTQNIGDQNRNRRLSEQRSVIVEYFVDTMWGLCSNVLLSSWKRVLGGSSTRHELLDWLIHKDLNEEQLESLVHLTI